ncbi:site-specific integrase [Paraburkholderia lycopersici]|uniref:Phage integrase family protein n=1 Tax=Paraburkholderia lycopersici TaxID=416944 RepID=A0A1G6Z2U4_9BURK|nr:site-specific integrase [Paraburkholderia lycopersici]SDD96136.1 Phage integrase family protein [Paraburkholderia lycopersici]
MASITNRSRFFVSVRNNDAHYREFPFHRLADAKAYHASLVAQKLKPTLGQFEDTIEIRIRQKGYPDQNHTARSVAEAEDMVETLRQERRRGLFRDYTKAHQVTFVDLIRRYMAEEGPKHKGWEKVEQYKCRGWLEDVSGTLAKRIEQRTAEIAATGRATTARGAMRQPATGLEWMEKPFAQVQTTDIEGYIRDRLDIVAPATVDRDVDVLSAICNVAIAVWKYRVDENPMTGVRRPRYFNERDRRLKPGEEARLFAAAREEDGLRSIDLHTEALMAPARDTAARLSTTYRKKAHLKAALVACRAQAEAGHDHIPLYEAFVSFQVMTAARRGEALNLTWDYVDLDGQTAYLPETKNGRARKLPLRADLIAILAMLPRDQARVFPLGTDALDHAWARMTERAGLADLHLHDLRHEGISRVAETGLFSLVDLQAFSGHRDTRMLLRYAHLCTKQLADRLDAAFGVKARQSDLTVVHRGRRRLRAGTGLTLAAIAGDFGVEVASNTDGGPGRDTGDMPQSNVIAFRRAD